VFFFINFCSLINCSSILLHPISIFNVKTFMYRFRFVRIYASLGVHLAGYNSCIWYNEHLWSRTWTGEREIEIGGRGKWLTIGLGVVGVAVMSGAVKSSGASRRSQHDPRDRIRVLRWGPVAAAVNLVSWAPVPYLPFIVLRDRGPPASSTAGHPRSGSDQGLDLVVGPSRKEIN
jgi:hypothetical protein